MSRAILARVLLGIGVLALDGIALLIVVHAYLVVSYRQPLVLPSPTGRYAVGRAEYDWTDQSRIDPLADRAGAKRELAVWAWYPATPSPGATTAPYVPPAWAEARNVDQGLGRFIESNLSMIQTHSYADAPLAGAATAYPVIVMLPGMGPVATDYTVLAENLASHGYIVFGINPTYTSNLTVFPDGRVVPRSTMGTIPDSDDAAAADQDASRIGQVWTEDALFVMGQIERVSADQASPFYGRLDLAHMGLFGHSFGGATAASVCEKDARCQAGADLDGTIFSYQSEAPLQRPFLFMTEDRCGKNCQTMRQAYASSSGAAYYLPISGTRHFNFSDLPLRLLPLSRVPFRMVGYIGSIRPQRGLKVANVYLVAFFDTYLKGSTSSLLQGPAPEYPEAHLSRR